MATDNAELGYVLARLIQIHDPDRARQTFARMLSVQEDSAAAHPWRRR